MKMRWGWIAGVAGVVAIVPSLGLGQGAGERPRLLAGDRVVVAEVREVRCLDGTRSVRVQLSDAGDQPVEIRLIDSRGYVSTYVLAQARRPGGEHACSVRWPDRGPVFPWY